MLQIRSGRTLNSSVLRDIQSKNPTSGQYNVCDSPVSNVHVTTQPLTPELIELINTAVVTALSKVGEQVMKLIEKKI